MMIRNRPASVTILALLVFFLSTSKLVRLIISIQGFGFYNQILPFDPLYLIFSGIVWTVIGFPLAFGLWFGISWAPRYSMVASVAYSIYYWFEYFLLVHAQKTATNLVFMIVLNIFAIIWVFWIFSRAQVNSFFGVNNE